VKRRCAWPGEDPLYLRYHDEEWGRPVTDDHRLFEKICLEGFQAGLSWLTILRKREAFRRAFAGFDLEKVAAFGEAQVRRLLADASIIRHRGKIESTVNNARQALALRGESGSLAAYFWGFEPKPGEAQAAAAVLARDLKRRGWTFVGPTTVYAFMQAMGMVNDHERGCFAWAEVERARRRFQRPPRTLP